MVWIAFRSVVCHSGREAEDGAEEDMRMLQWARKMNSVEVPSWSW
jgi:hypothetical protein